MSKSLKKVLAGFLLIGAFSSVLPQGNYSLGLVEANASTYKSAVNGELSSLNVYRGSGSELQLRSSFYGKEVDLSAKRDYYIELNASEGIDISAEAAGDGYVVKAFTSAAKDQEGQDLDKYIKVDSDTNIYLRTYESEEDYRDAYDRKDVTKCADTYILHIKKKEVISDEELDAEYAYLRNIYLSDGKIGFSKTKTSYDINVNEDVEELVVRATPDDDDISVEINEKDVTEDDNYESTVKLDKGNNTITIKTESNDDKQTYTLNVYRGKKTNVEASSDLNIIRAESPSQDITSSLPQNLTGTLNSWQKVNGKLQYINGIGEVLKNKWWFDSKTGNDYYLDENGYAKTGWFSDNNKWYYFNENGEMQKGWKQIGSDWYYLNQAGIMKTGWFKDADEKWYYLDDSGKMLKDTTIDGYNLDSSGVCI